MTLSSVDPVIRLSLRGALLLLLSCGWSVSGRAAQSADEVAAAFLFNFARFVTWPSAAFSGVGAPITIGFVGNAAMADLFEQNVKGKNANGREFAVRKLEGLDGVEACQIVYVADASLTGTILGAVKGKPVLTVGQSDVFLAAGGMIAFSKDSARLVFDLHADNLKAAGLQADPKIEKAARSVKHG